MITRVSRETGGPRGGAIPLTEELVDAGSWIGVAGILIGLAVAYWQWRSAKTKGDILVIFLHGLKACDLPPKAVEQVNDMLARLDPPRMSK